MVTCQICLGAHDHSVPYIAEPETNTFEAYGFDANDVFLDLPLPDTIIQPDIDRIASYWHALTNVGGVYCINKYLYVLQDWDSSNEMLKVCH